MWLELQVRVPEGGSCRERRELPGKEKVRYKERVRKRESELQTLAECLPQVSGEHSAWGLCEGATNQASEKHESN